MDLLFPYVIHLAILFASVLSLIFFLVRKPKFNSKPNVPPGKKGLPIVGETLDLIMHDRHGTSEHFITDRMSKYSEDIFKTSILGFDTAVFCGASGNKFIFSNEHLTYWAPSSLKKLLPEIKEDTSTNNRATKLRNLLSEFLKPDGLQHYIPIMDAMAKNHLQTHCLPHQEVGADLLSGRYTFAVACRLFLNVTNPELVTKLENAFALVRKAITTFPINLPGTLFNRATKGTKIIRDELSIIIKQRRRELAENKGKPLIVDVLTRMLLATDENGNTMSEDEIGSKIIVLLVASDDPITTLSTLAVNNLIKYPQVYREVLREQMEIAKSKSPGELLNWGDINKMKYTWSVVCETLRLQPVALGVFKEATTEFTYKGFIIPKGWKVFWTPYSTQKNSKHFPVPEKFDPSRFEGNGPAPFTFVPWGGGPNMCPGKEYSRAELLVFLHNFVTKFKWQVVNPNQKTIYKLFSRPVDGLRICLRARDD